MSMTASIEVATAASMITIGQSDLQSRRLKQQQQQQQQKQQQVQTSPHHQQQQQQQYHQHQQQPKINSHAPEPKAKSQEIVETQAQGPHSQAQAQTLTQLLLSKTQQQQQQQPPQPSLPVEAKARAPARVVTFSSSSSNTNTKNTNTNTSASPSISPISSNIDIQSIPNTSDPKDQSLPSLHFNSTFNLSTPSFPSSAGRPHTLDFSAQKQQQQTQQHTQQQTQQQQQTPYNSQRRPLTPLSQRQQQQPQPRRRQQPSSSQTRPHSFPKSGFYNNNPSSSSAGRGGYTSMDDGYSSQGGYSSHGGMWSPDESKYSNNNSNNNNNNLNGGGYSSGNGSNSGRRRTTPPSSPRQKSRYYGDRRHARQYLKNMQRIHTTYTPFWLMGHIGLILYRIIMLLCTPSPFQLVSFTHLVYLTDTAFHIFSLAWHLLRFPKLERITVIYGTWVVWIGWGLAIWLSDPDMEIHQQEHRAAFGIHDGMGSSGMGGHNHHHHPWYQPHHTYRSNDSVDINKLLPLAPFVKKYSNWYILYMPVATFLGLLMFRRNLWGLISWEHLTRMDQIGQLKYYRAWCLSGVGAGWALAWRFCRWWFHVPFMPMDDPTFCRYASSGKSCLDLLEAAAAAQRASSSGHQFAAQIIPTVVRYRTDVIEFRFWPMILSNLVMGLILMCWWSFWTFQYQGVVWREDLKEGWAVWRTTTGGVMTGLVTDEELRKSVKDWTGARSSSSNGGGGTSEHQHHQRRHSAQPAYSDPTTPQ